MFFGLVMCVMNGSYDPGSRAVMQIAVGLKLGYHPCNSIIFEVIMPLWQFVTKYFLPRDLIRQVPLEQCKHLLLRALKWQISTDVILALISK